jgi:hypothetical protein
MKTLFFGDAYVARSQDFADQRCINLYPEIAETGAAKEIGAFYGTPGLDLLTSVGPGPIRGMIPQEGTLYVVSGSSVYSLTSKYVATSLGTLATAAGPVSMITNLTQAAIFDGLNGYSISSGTLAQITSPTGGTWFAGVGAFQDGFGVVNSIGTQNVYQSNLNDLTTWGSLSFTVADGSSDAVVGIASLHRQLVVFKEDRIEFQINAGTSPYVFARLEGVYPHAGCAAPYSIANLGETVCWLGQNKDGGNVVYMLGGYEAVRISTHAIEFALGQYSTVSDAIGYGYEQEGHFFYQLTLPTGNATWVYDLTESRKAGRPMWHQRAAFSAGAFNRHQSSCCAYFNGQVVVGDSTNGNLYAYDLNTYTDNGAPRKWLRSWRATKSATIKTLKCNMLEVDCETGVSVPPGLNPQVMLRQSFDGGQNWSRERFAPAGQTGQTNYRVQFRRLGMVRRGIQSDRILELSGTDPIKIALLGAEMLGTAPSEDQ